MVILIGIDINCSHYWSIHHTYQKLIYREIYLGDMITGLDFNPAGESVATIDDSGVCLISDVNTGNYSYHLKIGSKDGN